MSWPVRIIFPPEPVPHLKWKRWGRGLLLLLSTIMFAGWLLGVMKVIESNHLISASLPLVIVFIGGYLVSLALRIYYQGVCLSAYDGYVHDAQALREKWTEWASRPLYIPASHFFLPSQVVLQDIMMGKPADIAKGQALKFDVGEQAYTEEELFNELLSSVRVKIKQLSSTHVFDVIFTHEENNTSFSVFRECWRAIGLDEKMVERCYFFKYSHDNIYEHVLNAEDNRFFIVVSIRVDSQQQTGIGTTEFASILLMSKEYSGPDKVNCGVMLRPMLCSKNGIEDEFTLMRTYQPEIPNATRVLFSHLEQPDIVNVTDVLRKTLSAEVSSWEFDVYDLNMFFGQLSGEHFWLSISLSLYLSEIKKESSLMINGIGDQVVFNVIKPFNYQKESVNWKAQ